MSEDIKIEELVEEATEIVKVDDSTKNLIARIMEEENAVKLKDLTHLFKVHMAKKNIVRIIKYYDMIDLVNKQTFKRLEARPDEISNKDLISFMTTFLTTIEKTTETLSTLDDTTSGLTINQQHNEVNINVGPASLDRESKERVIDTVKNLLALMVPGGSLNSEESKVVEEDEVEDDIIEDIE